MEVLVLFFVLLSVLVLGLLCLLVLEYEHLRVRRWSRLRSGALPPASIRPRPSRPPAPAEPAFSIPKALDVLRPLP